MYSLTPFIADAPKYGIYIVFWVFLFCLGMLAYCMSGVVYVKDSIQYKEDKVNDIIITAYIGIVTVVVVGLFVTQKVDPPPNNVKLTGTLVKVEDYAARGPKGRTNYGIYVMYKVEDKVVPFEACTGCAYPEKAVIYRKY